MDGWMGTSAFLIPGVWMDDGDEESESVTEQYTFFLRGEGDE